MNIERRKTKIDIISENITIKNGSFLNEDVQVLAHGCNCQGAMGKGAALAFFKKYPEIKDGGYSKYCKSGLFTVGKILKQQLSDGKIGFNLATQDRWGYTGKRATTEHIESCLIKLREWMTQNNKTTLAIPPIGCSNGGLSRDQVYPIIESIFKDTNISVAICDTEKS